MKTVLILVLWVAVLILGEARAEFRALPADLPPAVQFASQGTLREGKATETGMWSDKCHVVATVRSVESADGKIIWKKYYAGGASPGGRPFMVARTDSTGKYRPGESTPYLQLGAGEFWVDPMIQGKQYEYYSSERALTARYPDICAMLKSYHEAREEKSHPSREQARDAES